MDNTGKLFPALRDKLSSFLHFVITTKTDL